MMKFHYFCRYCRSFISALGIVLLGTSPVFSDNPKDLRISGAIEIFSGGKRFKSVAEYRRYQFQEKGIILENNLKPYFEEQTKDVFVGQGNAAYLPQMQEMLAEYLKEQGESPLTLSLDSANMKTIILDGPKGKGWSEGQAYSSILWSLAAYPQGQGLQGIDLKKFLQHYQARSKSTSFLPPIRSDHNMETFRWPSFSFIFDPEQIKRMSHFLRTVEYPIFRVEELYAFDLKKFPSMVNIFNSFESKILNEKLQDSSLTIFGKTSKKLERRLNQNLPVDQGHDNPPLSVVGLDEEAGLPPIIIDRDLLPPDYFKEEIDTN